MGCGGYLLCPPAVVRETLADGWEFMASLAAVMASEMIANIWRAGVDFRSLVPDVAPPLTGAGGRDVLMMGRSMSLRPAPPVRQWCTLLKIDHFPIDP